MAVAGYDQEGSSPTCQTLGTLQLPQFLTSRPVAARQARRTAS